MQGNPEAVQWELKKKLNIRWFILLKCQSAQLTNFITFKTKAMISTTYYFSESLFWK